MSVASASAHAQWTCCHEVTWMLGESTINFVRYVENDLTNIITYENTCDGPTHVVAPSLVQSVAVRAAH